MAHAEEITTVDFICDWPTETEPCNPPLDDEEEQCPPTERNSEPQQIDRC